MDFKNISNKYRPVPFWSWNEKLTVEETRRQIDLMNEAGIGGYFMHARGGLQTEYMSDDWFSNIEAGAEQGEKLGMLAWAYDENGWPSGFGNGLVTQKGIKYQQKFLRFESEKNHPDRYITENNGLHFYYDVNPFYVDVLDEMVVGDFINEIYKPYHEKFGNKIEGFFTDEPQISRDGIPWSFTLPEKYKEAYNEDLLAVLAELFMAVGNYEDTRFKFWRLVTELFSQSFSRQIFEWCDERGLKFTGHMVEEDSFTLQLTTNGAIMPNYEYFHIPGMDWLGRHIKPELIPLQVSSAAHQLSKKQILSETFALTGWNVSFEELKWIFEWQMVRGVTLLCPHLEGYSLRGIRKRDYPPSLFYQQPWWNKYKYFVDSMSRVGMLLSEGEVVFDTLLIHPQSTAWLLFDNDKNEGLSELEDEFEAIIDSLTSKHILFHLGDETIMSRHAGVSEGGLIIGSQRYKRVILPPHKILFDSTKKLLEEFSGQGGSIISDVRNITANDIIDNENITYTRREFDDFKVHYFVNSTEASHKAKIKAGNKVMNLITGELSDFSGEHEFLKYESLVVIDDGSAALKPAENIEYEPLLLSGEWEIKASDLNSLTLDYCDYWFDNELICKNEHVSTIQEKACALERKVDIKMEFKVEVLDIPEEIYLVCETPDIFKIKINDRELTREFLGYYRDKSFEKADISGYFVKGTNIISMETEFLQSENTYKSLKNSKIFEGEKNKLSYDLEIESIYLAGDFGVQTDGEFLELERNASRYIGDFKIVKKPERVYISDIEKQKFPFFNGSMTLRKTFKLDDKKYAVKFFEKCANIVEVSVNGGENELVLWRPYEATLNTKDGENEIEITLTNDLRNLLGPHHVEVGESYAVVPSNFYKDKSIWEGWNDEKWNDDYCFVKFGLR